MLPAVLWDIYADDLFAYAAENDDYADGAALPLGFTRPLVVINRCALRLHSTEAILSFMPARHDAASAIRP